MRQSNTYIIMFSIITTAVIGGLLALANILLGDAQRQSEMIDTKKKILSTVMTVDPKWDAKKVEEVYSKRIKSAIVDFQGAPKVAKNSKGEELTAENVNIGKEFKTPKEQRSYPVFMFISETNPNEVEAYVFPMFGAGLWDAIWGYVAVEKDLSTIKGVVFDHKAETPGLGARIADKDVQERFKGKLISMDGKYIQMIKGEGPDKTKDKYQVDGMSGATITGTGLNRMLRDYLGENYKGYIETLKKQTVTMDTVPAVSDSMNMTIDSANLKNLPVAKDPNA